MEWVFNENNGNAIAQGDAEFNTVLNSQKGHDDKSLFIREAISNSADQKLPNTTEPVEIYIDVIEVSGDAKESFKNSLNWDSLKEHINASAKDLNNPLHRDLKKGAESINDNQQSIILVKISDYNARGLVGDEFDFALAHENSIENFGYFCRAKFVTPTTGDRQGSFGIGKATFYHVSRINTALMSSSLSDDGGFRVFGRSELPTHFINDMQMMGNGCFGKRVDNRGASAAKSVFDASSKNISNLFLDRDMGDAPGTTVLSIAFDHTHITPGRLMREFQSNVEQWFWPALCVQNPKLSITLRRFDNHECKDVQKIDISNNSQYKPFIDAFIGEANSNLKLGSTQFDVPEKRRQDPSLPTDKGFASRSEIALKIEDESIDRDHHLKNTIALLRNDICVVDYEEVSLKLPDRNIFGVLKAGTARGNTPEDLAMHEFLRNAEPPLHNNWRYAPKIQAIYKTVGKGQKELSQFKNSYKADIRKLIQEEDVSDSESLDHFSQFFKFGSAGTTTRPKLIDFSIENTSLEGHVLECTYKVKRNFEATKNWKVSVETRIKNATQVDLEIIEFDTEPKYLDKRVSPGKMEFEFDPNHDTYSVTVSSAVPASMFTIEECRLLNFKGSVNNIKD